MVDSSRWVFFPTLVGLFIIGIMWYWYIRLNFALFWFASTLKLWCWNHLQKSYFSGFYCSLIFVSSFGGLVDDIKYRVSSFPVTYFNRQRFYWTIYRKFFPYSMLMIKWFMNKDTYSSCFAWFSDLMFSIVIW